MSDLKISELPPTSTVVDADEFAVTHGGVTSRLSYGNLKTKLDSDIIGVLPIAKGGTNSSTALANGKVMISESGTIKEGNLSGIEVSGTTIYGPADINFFRKTGTTTFENWYSTNIVPFTPGASVFAADFLSFMPFLVPKSITLDRIAMEVTVIGTIGSVIRLGIYDSLNSIPNALVLDAGTILADSATVQAITINQVLTPGLYWLVMVTNSLVSPTLRTIPAASCSPVCGAPSTFGAAATTSKYTRAFPYAALPASAGATTKGTGAHQWIAVRASA